jgi:hypothetical protein
MVADIYFVFLLLGVLQNRKLVEYCERMKQVAFPGWDEAMARSRGDKNTKKTQ